MLGVAILIIVMSVMNGFKTDLTKKILGLNPHIVIQPNGFKIDEEFTENLKKKFNEINISKAYSGEGIVINNDNAKGIIIKGIDLNNKKNIKFIKENISEGDLKEFEKNTALIGVELAFNLNLEIGDKINLMSSAFVTTPFGGMPKQETFTVIGIFNTGFFEFDQNIVFLNIFDTLSLFDKEDHDQNLEIFLSNPMQANKFKEEIQKLNQNYFVYTWTDLNKSFFSALKVERNVMFTILTLIIIVAAFNIISGLTILIKNKTKEIAILKTLGLSNNSIKKSFFLTGFTIGFLATIAGILLGIIFSLNLDKIRNVLSNLFNFEIFPTDVYYLEKLPTEISVYSITIIFIFSLLISALASYLPAMSISKMKTFRALKYD
jgi:lipoprotein-releasing system permease protein